MLLLTVTVADLEWFTLKDKPITYTGGFVELYNWRNRGQIHEIYRMIEIEKIRTSTAENLHNFGVFQIIGISLVLYSVYVILEI